MGDMAEYFLEQELVYYGVYPRRPYKSLEQWKAEQRGDPTKAFLDDDTGHDRKKRHKRTETTGRWMTGLGDDDD